ncbi:MAG: thiamine phosphate synthase [Rhodospirillales bacterium]|nr:thiamine phosphate synthase [Rhodospirillales bacterium]
MDDTLLKQARQLNLRNGGPNCPIPPIILLTDDLRLPDPAPAIRSLPRDSMVIFRQYNHPQRARLGADLRSLCRAKGIPFLVANDIALALKLDADGIHLPEYRILTTPDVYCQIPSGFLITSACHNVATVRRLGILPRQYRPDGVLISPVFPTQSHPGANPLSFSDILTMASMCKHHGMAPIGLGGINKKNVGNLRSSPLASLAGIGFSAS